MEARGDLGEAGDPSRAVWRLAGREGGGVAPVWSWLNTPEMFRRPGAAAGIEKGVVMADNQQANQIVNTKSCNYQVDQSWKIQSRNAQ